MRTFLLLLLVGMVAAVEFPLAGPDLSGGRHEIDPISHKRPVVVVFWASWCAVCVREMPAIRRFHAAAKGRIDVVSCSIDTDSDAARTCATTNQLDYPVILDGTMAIADRFAVEATPTLILLGTDGRELARGRHLGQLQDALTKLEQP